MPVLPAKNHSQFICLGTYTGCTVQLDFDWVEAFDLIYPTPYNFISVHGITPWDNPDSVSFIERTSAGKFLTAKPNEAFYDHFTEMLDEAPRHDIGILWSFFDQYHIKKWLTSKWKTCKYHPFRGNDAGVNWEDSEEPLYSNWNHQNANDPKNFAWFFFRTDSQDNIVSYKPTNKLGEAMIYYIDRIFKIVAEMKVKRPRLKFRWKGFNESLLTTENNQWVPGGRDVDERTLRLMRKLAKAHGLTSNMWFREHIDVYIREKNGSKLNISRHKQLSNLVRPAYVEIHGFEGGTEIPSELNQALHCFSSDGANETNYYAKMKTIAKKKLKMFDYKMVPSKPWNSKVMMTNLKNAIGPMAGIFK